MPPASQKAVGLTAEDRRILRAWVARPLFAGLARRAGIVLGREGACSDAEVARSLGVSPRTVRSWCERFRCAGPGGLFDAPRPRSGRRVEERRAALVRRLACEDEAGTGPSTRAAAAAAGVSQSTVSRIWRELGVAAAPHRAAGALDLLPFACGECELAGVLAAAPDRMAAVATRNPARRCAPGAPLPPEISGLLARAAERAATLSLPRRAVVAWQFLDSMSARARGGQLHLLLADRCTLRLPSVRRWIEAHPRHRVHLPPAGTSWVEALERWIPWLLRSATAAAAVRDLREALALHLAGPPGAAAPFVWISEAPCCRPAKDS